MSDQAAAPQDTELPGMPAPNPLEPQPLVGPGAPPLTDGTEPVDIIAVTHALLRAANSCADRCSAGALPQDCKDLGAAALGLAQAVITLDPGRLKGGDHPSTLAQGGPPITPPTDPVTDRNHNGVINE